MKLLAMAPRILETNRATVDTMLDLVIGQIQTVPGYRSSLEKKISSSGTKTSGKLMVAMRGYWREFGTRTGYRGRKDRLLAYAAAFERANDGAGGEKAGLYASRALGRAKKIFALYWGKAWSRL